MPESFPYQCRDEKGKDLFLHVETANLGSMNIGPVLPLTGPPEITRSTVLTVRKAFLSI